MPPTRAPVAASRPEAMASVRSVAAATLARWDTHEGRAPGHERRQCRQHVALGLDIEVRRRLVEDQDRGVLDDRPRDRQALTLAAAQQQAVLADPRRVAVGQRRDGLVDASLAAGGLDRLVGHLRVGEREVVADRRVEQVHVLGHDAEHPPDVVGMELVELAAADQDLALVVVPEPQQQVDERRLPHPARPDDREAGAGRDDERTAVEDVRLVRPVAEADVRNSMAWSAMTGVGSRPGASVTSGAASVSSNRRRAAASLASSSANACDSGAMTSKLASATSGRSAR